MEEFTTTEFPMEETSEPTFLPMPQPTSGPDGPDGPPSGEPPTIPPPVTRRNFAEVIEIAEVEVVKGK